MAAAAGAGVDRARNGQHGPSLLGGMPCGDKRPTLHSCFHDNDCLAQAADDPVARWEQTRDRFLPHAGFSNQCSFRRDFLGQPAVLGWINAGQSARQYGQGAATGLQGGSVRYPVDAASQS
jgi:hypothetical protein